MSDITNELIESTLAAAQNGTATPAAITAAVGLEIVIALHDLEETLKRIATALEAK